jgi:hypothetical protein
MDQEHRRAAKLRLIEGISMMTVGVVAGAWQRSFCELALMPRCTG